MRGLGRRVRQRFREERPPTVPAGRTQHRGGRWSAVTALITARITALIVVVLVATVVPPAASASSGDVPTSVAVAAVDDLLRGELAAAPIPGAAVAVTRGDDVLLVRGYGHDSRGAPVTGDTPFRIASLSKSFTSLAVLRLVDANRLSLDDPTRRGCPLTARPGNARCRALRDDSTTASTTVACRNSCIPGRAAASVTGARNVASCAAPCVPSYARGRTSSIVSSSPSTGPGRRLPASRHPRRRP